MKKLFAVLAALFILVVMVNCSSNGDGSSSDGSKDTDTVASDVGTSGGSITTPSGDAAVTIPESALSSEAPITVSLSTRVTPPGNVGSSYEFTSNGQTFAAPVTISIKYDPNLLPAGVDPSKLKLARLASNGTWEIIEESTTDTINHVVSGPTNHFSTYSIVVNERKAFGEQTGEFNSVIAYSNGTTENISNEYNSYSGYNTGMKWLCDEYVNRYYKQIYDREIRIEGRKAGDYYANAAARGLTAYPNDGTEQPQVGDILISEYGDYGHVAIVAEVQDNKIFVIQQNWSDNGADDRYPVTRDGNHVYPFDGKKGNYEVKGWLRANTEAAAYSISGNITLDSAGMSGVTVTLMGATSSSTTTDSSGHYSFSGAVNGNYTITPSQTGYTFNLTSISITVNNANISGQNFTATPNTYTISGTVSGDVVAGVTITLTGTGSRAITTDSSGHYSFTGAANGNYTITASKTDYSFTPAIISATVNNANLTGQNFTATANTYTITGQVNLNGAGMAGVTVTLTGSGSVSIVTGADGTYTFTNAANGSYVLSFTCAGYIFSPSPLSIEISNADYTVPYVIAATPVYTISGKVSGDVVSGVTITLTGTGSVTTTTDGSGNYSFSGAASGSYTITPSKTGYIFNPVSINATVNNANLTGQNFTAAENTYTISGAVSGDIISGVTITLTGTGSVTTTTDSNGNYSFIGAQNGNYTITASKAGYTFSPTSIAITVSNVDVTGKNFTSTGSGSTLRIVYHSDQSGNFDIWKTDEQGTNKIQLTNSAANEMYPKWSKNGQKIVYNSDISGNDDIWLMNNDGSVKTQLTTNAAGDDHPIWTPDSTKILFFSYRDGGSDIYIMDANGANQTRLTTINGKTGVNGIGISPDGTKITYTSQSSGGNWGYNSELYSATLTCAGNASTCSISNILKIASFDSQHDTAPGFTPDGKILWASGRNNPYGQCATNCYFTTLEIFRINSDGIGEVKITSNTITSDREPVATPDGSKIIFTSDRAFSSASTSNTSDLWIVNSDGTGMTQVTNTPAYNEGSADCINATALSTILFSETFESYSIGSAPSGWSVACPGVSVVVSSTQANNGSKSVFMQGGAYNGSNLDYNVSGLSMTYNTYDYTFYMYTDDTQWTGTADGREGSSLEMAGIGVGMFVDKIGSTFTLVLAGSVEQTLAFPASTGTWVKYDIVFNPSTKTVSYYVNDSFVGNGSTFTSARTMLEVAAGSANVGNPTAYFDDLLIVAQ